MSFSVQALSDRTMSAYPISIGTSLALESIFDGPNPTYDPERIIPERVDITHYEEMWINLYTLYRNIIGALKKDDFNKVMPLDLCDTLEFETDLIKRLIEDKTFGSCKVIYYASDYSGLEKKYPHARLRGDTTDKQKMYTILLIKTINAFIKRQVKTEYIKHFDLEIKPTEKKKTIIITNYAIDLLNHRYFKELDLLESHTGQCINRALWYNKFYDGKHLMRIPFNHYFLQIFGDKTIFLPWPKSIRDEITTIANKNKWVYNTSKDRILMGIGNIKDGYTVSIIKDMIK